MITFKEYLTEGAVKKWSKSTLTNDAAKALLGSGHTAWVNALANGGLLFRGDPKLNFKKMTFIDTTTGTRTSRDSSNAYQLMMDVSFPMRSVPSRSKSLICATGLDIAAEYADDVFVVIPADGTVVAASRQSDFLHKTHIGPFILDQTESSLGAFDEIMNRLFIKLKLKPKAKKWADADYLNTELDKLSPETLANAASKYLHGYVSEPELKDVIEYFSRVKTNRFTSLASSIMTPTKLEIQVKPYGSALPRDAECWVSGKVIMMPFWMFAEMVIKLKPEGIKIHKSYKLHLQEYEEAQ
jgi:hypothetical protein